MIASQSKTTNATQRLGSILNVKVSQSLENVIHIALLLQLLPAPQLIRIPTFEFINETLWNKKKRRTSIERFITYGTCRSTNAAYVISVGTKKTKRKLNPSSRCLVPSAPRSIKSGTPFFTWHSVCSLLLPLRVFKSQLAVVRGNPTPEDGWMDWWWLWDFGWWLIRQKEHFH